MLSNYKHSALLCTVIKIFENVAYKYIFNLLVDNALIYKFLSEFIPGHSTAHQLIELTHEIMQSLDNQQLIYLIFGDASKALDRVWLRGLLLKLERCGIKGYFFVVVRGLHLELLLSNTSSYRNVIL